jgi:nucleotide-binding universal stress UspA family protein
MLLSRYPILAVPEEAKIDHISRIVYATDYDENDFENLVNVAAFAHLYDAEIRIIHIVRQESLREQILFEGYKTLVTRENIYHNIHHNMVVGEDFYESVNQYIKDCEGSVLAMTSDRKSTFEKLFSRSLTHHMLYHTHVPFLVLKPNSIL